MTREQIAQAIFTLLVLYAGIPERYRYAFVWRYDHSEDYQFDVSTTWDRTLIFSREMGVWRIRYPDHPEEEARTNDALRALNLRILYMSPLERLRLMNEGGLDRPHSRKGHRTCLTG